MKEITTTTTILGLNEITDDMDAQSIRRLFRRKKEEEMMEKTGIEWTKSPK